MFEEGESIRVVDGPFANFSGYVDEVMQEKEKLRVTLDGASVWTGHTRE